jgi:hypothetical protein
VPFRHHLNLLPGVAILIAAIAARVAIRLPRGQTDLDGARPRVPRQRCADTIHNFVSNRRLKLGSFEIVLFLITTGAESPRP